MANPNLNSSDVAIYAGSDGYAVTTSMAAFVSNSSNSNTVVHITNLMVANVDGVNAADITVELFNGTTGFSYCRTLTVPPDATQVLLARDGEVFLKEGYSLRAQASAAGDLEITWTEKRIG